MSTTTRSTGRTITVAIRAMLVLTVLLGIGYPAVITVAAQALPWQAHGSIVTDPRGRPVGSALIGQSFADERGVPLPAYFQSRPSAADHDGALSTASNLGTGNPDLTATVADRRALVARMEGVDVSAVPADAVTASASGLDPHVSVVYADLQVPRVAAARGMSEDELRAIVRAHTAPRDLGFLGEDRVNVLELNQDLDARHPAAQER